MSEVIGACGSRAGCAGAGAEEDLVVEDHCLLRGREMVRLEIVR